MSDARKLSAALVVLFIASPANAATLEPTNDDEIKAALALYDAGQRVAAAEAAEALLLRADLSPGERRTLALLAAASRRDAYREAPAGHADPAHLCTALRGLDAYLREPAADQRVADMRAEISTTIAADPSIRCPAPEPTPAPPPEPAPPPKVEPSAQPAPTASLPSPPPLARDAGPTPRQLRIAGGVTLGLGGGLLATMVYGLASQSSLNHRADAIFADVTDKWVTGDEHAALQDLRADGVNRRNLAIGAGVTAAVLSSVGIALLVKARRAEPRAGRWSVTTSLGPTSISLALQLP